MPIILNQFLRFCILILLQTLLLDKIVLQWWSSPSGFPVFIPYIYPLFILLLPLSTPVWALLFIGFATGLTVDVFTNTAGMHAFACVLIAYLRTNVLNALLPKHLTEYGDQVPGIKNMGWVPFLTYSAFLIFIHHFTFYLIEIWSLRNPGYLALKIVASTLTSILLVVVYLLLFSKRAPSRK